MTGEFPDLTTTEFLDGYLRLFMVTGNEDVAPPVQYRKASQKPSMASSKGDRHLTVTVMPLPSNAR